MNTIRTTLLTATLSLAALAAHGQGMPPPAVVTAPAEIALLAPTVDVPGTVVSRNDARLAAEVSAKLRWILDVGTPVKEGDTIAKMEDLTFQLNEMEAASKIEAEQARVKFLSSEVERLQRLAERNNTARSQLDQTVADLEVAKSDEKIARVRHGLAQIALALTEIKAPFDGIVTERLRNAGERVNTADEVVRLVNPASVEVVARAPLNTVNFVDEGDELAIHNDYREGSGKIRTIVPVGSPQSHMFEVRLDVDAETWTVGESLRLSMPTANAREVLAVPRDALVLRREGTSVFRISSEQKAEQVSVVTGLGAGELIEVIGDLNAGDRIVIRGAERLAPGMSVNVTGGGGAVASSAANP